MPVPTPSADTFLSAPGLVRNRRYQTAVACAWLIVLLAICVRVGVSPQRQSAFAADYLPAGVHWIHGLEVYRARAHFIYSPLVAAAFAPFAVLPARLGGIVWRIGCVAALGWAAAAWLRSGLSGLGDAPALPPASPVMTTAFLLMLPLAAGNANVGQMNLLVLTLTAGSVLAAGKHRWNLAALLLAIGGFMKIYPLAVGLLLALIYPRQLPLRLLAALCILFIVSLVLQRPAYAWSEYGHWFNSMGADTRLDIDLSVSWRDFAFLLRASGVPVPDRVVRVLEVAAGAALAIYLWLGQQRWGWPESRSLGGIFSLGCAWMLLFGPATEGATYVLLSLPVCAALTAAWALPPAPGQSRAIALPAIFVTSYALLLLADVTDAWVKGGRNLLYLRALQPIAALVFAAGIICWLQRRPLRRAV